MEEFDFLKKLEAVKAPPDFEQKVMAQLALRKERKSRKLRYFRFSFASLAGAAAAAGIIFAFLNIFVFEEKRALEFTELKKDVSAVLERGKGMISGEAIPIIESLDYSREVRSLSAEPETIYILEQVSDVAHKEIKY